MVKRKKSTIASDFLQYQATDRTDIYSVGHNAWVSIVRTTCLPSHLLSAPQAESVVANFAGLLNGTLAGDPNPALTLQFLLLQYPSSFADLIKKYDDRAAALAEAGRTDASNIAWAWHEYLTGTFTKRVHRRMGAVAITARPFKEFVKDLGNGITRNKKNVLNKEDAFSLLDDTAGRVSSVLNENGWGGERLAGDDLVEVLSLWALGSARKPQDENAIFYAWEG